MSDFGTWLALNELDKKEAEEDNIEYYCVKIVLPTDDDKKNSRYVNIQISVHPEGVLPNDIVIDIFPHNKMEAWGVTDDFYYPVERKDIL